MMKNTTAFILTLLLLLICTVSAHAQTPVSNEEAVNYYNSCKQKADPRMRPETHDAFCACTAEKIMQNMSVEEVRTMGEQSQAGRDMLNKMLVDVYAPCMNYPVTDLVEAKCLSNKNLDVTGVKTPKDTICFCTATKTAEWFVQEGRTLMKSVLMKNPNIMDPIEPVMESRAFKSQSYSNMISCLQNDGN